LPLLRRLMNSPASSPSVLVLAPPARSYDQIGAAREAVRLDVQPYQQLAILATEGIDAAVVSSLEGWPLDDVRAIVVLSPSLDALSPGDLPALRAFLARGGKLVTSPQVGTVLAGGMGMALRPAFGGFVGQQGDLYVAQQGLAILFEDERQGALTAFWREVLGLDVPRPGYRLVTDRFAFQANLGPEPATFGLALPFEAIGYRYDDQGRPVEQLRGSRLQVTLGRREFILLSRVRRAELAVE
jgi:hypothetical protein